MLALRAGMRELMGYICPAARVSLLGQAQTLSQERALLVAPEVIQTVRVFNPKGRAYAIKHILEIARCSPSQHDLVGHVGNAVTQGWLLHSFHKESPGSGGEAGHGLLGRLWLSWQPPAPPSPASTGSAARSHAAPRAPAPARRRALCVSMLHEP